MTASSSDNNTIGVQKERCDTTIQASDLDRYGPGNYTPTIRHIHIEYGALKLDFRATADHADNVAAQLNSQPDVVATIDDDLSGDLPLLPCSRLWRVWTGAI